MVTDKDPCLELRFDAFLDSFLFFSLAATPYSAETAAGSQVVTGTDVRADAQQWSRSQSFPCKRGGRGGFHVRALQGELAGNTAGA